MSLKPDIKSSRVEDLHTDVCEFQSILEELKTLQSLCDRFEQLPKCGLRDDVILQIGYLLNRPIYEGTHFSAAKSEILRQSKRIR